MLVNLPRVVFEFWNLNLGAQLGISLNKGSRGSSDLRRKSI
jgi:hypothetical protein